MSINDFMKKNEVAILVIADLETKTFDIRKSNIELKSDVLYKEFVLYNDVNALETYISGQVLMPRIFSQGNSLLKTINNGEDFVQAMADKYSNPEVDLNQYPGWIKNILTLIDYDSELQMDGLDYKSYKNVIDALNDVGLYDEAQALQEIEEDSTEKAAEECYSKLAINNDYELFWDTIFEYADKNLKSTN